MTYNIMYLWRGERHVWKQVRGKGSAHAAAADLWLTHKIRGWVEVVAR